MWNLLKNLINSKLFLYCVIGGLIYFYIQDTTKNRVIINRLENNQTAYAQQHSMQIQLTLSQFKKLEVKEDSIVKLIGLKPKQLQNIIVNNYHYKDTTIIEVPLDTTVSKDTLSFIVPLKCMIIKGEVINNEKVRLLDVELNDTLHTFIYKKHNKRFLFIKWGKYYDAITYSECMQKNINIEKNIKIIK